jgi:glycosyltransferase involved in cell wall biosynthesis
MRILLDFTQIPRTRTGVGVYADHLLENLLMEMASDDQLLIVLQDDEDALPEAVQTDSRVSFHHIKASRFRNRAAVLLYEQFALPRLANRWQADVLHSLHYTFPLWSRVARVVTVHDLNFFLWPEFATRSRILFFRPFIRLALRWAEAIVFVSEATARDARALVPEGQQIRLVAPLGVSKDVFRRPSDQEIDAVLHSFLLKKPYLLFIGTIEPRKNVVRLIEAFERLAPEFPLLTLVLAGKLGWACEPFEEALRASSVANRIQHLGFVTDAERQALLAGAAVLVYPSLYEGFGLPVLEGMAMGTPVVTSNVSSLPEVAGDGALMTDPRSVEGMAHAVRTLLNTPPIAAGFAARGLERARTFTWQRTAHITYSAYRKAAKAHVG